MKGWLFSISILLSAWLVFTIQQTHFNLGYIMAAVLYRPALFCCHVLFNQ
jgi:hypothetical protein